MFLGLARLSFVPAPPWPRARSIRYLPNKLPDVSIGENCSAETDGGGDFANNDYRAIAGSIRRTAPSSASVNR